ncbi:HAMP domain-containing protein [Desulfonatronum thiosulfatophilum]|uniref:histidine kinase n=1 Tax=Desulfonatronum thiosulfatophilum TaxID=617002 RepID=A0A1G6BP03_9BACT|nr:ATP-binding protein [Desulfonatronum thiosulfatophilum]SDB22354.1 HAMP domain-containing protein [Desulfonatronum thiosulfatophilum]
MLHRIPTLSDYFSLRSALVISVILPLAMAMGLTGYLLLQLVERNIEHRMQKDLELVARAIQLPLSHSMELKRQGSVLRAVESAFSIGRVYSAYVYDRQGRRIASAGRSEPTPEQERLTELAADGKQRGEYGNVAGREVFSYFVPLTDSGGRINGLLQLTRRKSDIQEDVRAVRARVALGLGLGLLFMSGLVLFGHHRALGQYLSSLENSMSRVAEGDQNHRLQPHGPKEIVNIGRQFNRMLDTIEEAKAELRERRIRQMQLQAQLRQTEKLAAIGELAAGVAHELGTPLSVVSGKAQRVLRKSALDAEIVETLRDIRREVDRMEHIIRQLLDFSRCNALRKKPTCLTQLIRSAVSAVSEDAENHRTCLETVFPLGNANEALQINLDSVRMEQVLVNLIRNAVQSASGGRAVVSCGKKENQAWMQVDDDGPGIPLEIETKLFEPFFTTKSVGHGTGLGLAVVHGILRDHGGSIEFGKSRLGGAFFRIWLSVDHEPTIRG